MNARKTSRWRYGLAILSITLLLAVVLSYRVLITDGGQRHQTDRQLDVAIVGTGYFQVKDRDSEAIHYTRSGSLHLDCNGVFSVGSANVEPPITMPSDYTSIVILPDGRVQCEQGNVNGVTDVGQIELARFNNPDGLREVLPGVFADTEASGVPLVGEPGTQGMGLLAQGWRESPIRVPGLMFGMGDLLSAALIVVLVWIAVELRGQCRWLRTLLNQTQTSSSGPKEGY